MEDTYVFERRTRVINLQKISLFVVTVSVLYSCTVVSATKFYEMKNNCDDKISMIYDDIKQGQLSLNTPRTFSHDNIYQFGQKNSRNRCDVTIETWYTWDHLMFYFESFNLPCSDGYLEFFDGDFRDQINGLEGHICGSLRTDVFVTINRKLKVKFTRLNYNYRSNAFSLIFTAYQTASGCKSYNFECDNGRCIDDDIRCNGYNSCGDDSGCRTDLSVQVIVYIVIGSLAGFIGILTVIVMVFCYIRGQKRRKNMRTQPVVYNANTAGQQPYVVYGAQNQPNYVTGQTPAYPGNTPNPGYTGIYPGYPQSSVANQMQNNQTSVEQDQI